MGKYKTFNEIKVGDKIFIFDKEIFQYYELEVSQINHRYGIVGVKFAENEQRNLLDENYTRDFSNDFFNITCICSSMGAFVFIFRADKQEHEIQVFSDKNIFKKVVYDSWPLVKDRIIKNIEKIRIESIKKVNKEKMRLNFHSEFVKNSKQFFNL